MLDSVWELVFQRIDFFWIAEIAICAFAWVLLRGGALIKPSHKQLILEFCLQFALLVLLNVLCLAVSMKIPGYVFPFLWAAVQGFVAFLYLQLSPTYLPKAKTLVWIAQYTASLCLMAMAGLSSILISSFLGSGEAFIRLAIYLMIPLVALFLRNFDYDEYSAVPRSGIRLLSICAICVLLLYVTETIFFMGSDSITIVLLVSYSCLFAVTCSAIQTMHALCHEQNALLELQAEKSRFVAERELTQMAEHKLEDLRCIRHDLKNQYSYMQILLAEKRYDELQQYFAKLSENLPAQLNMIDCGNRMMNTVLNMELAKLKSDRILFEHQLVVPPVLPFPDEDVCAIVTNLLDNAADECRRLLKKGSPEVKVRLEIYPHQSYLYIKCSNSTDRVTLSRAKGGLRTTKEDEQMHGYGTRIITKLAEKHNGCADYSLDDGRFVAQVMLDMTEENSHED